MRFLVTNDDGVHAPGIAILAEAVAQFGAATVIAPDEPASGCSHLVNTGRPLKLTEHGDNRFSIDGSPADCARVGALYLDTDADWIVSGVNHGGNLGVDIFMSGTVAAVREAAWLGLPGMAFSQYRKTPGEFDWSKTGRWVSRVVEQLVEEDLPPGAFWNINFPDLTGEVREPRIIFCGLEYGHLQMEYHHEDGALHYRGVYHDRSRNPGSDVDVCFSGDIAVTQILPQTTAH